MNKLQKIKDWISKEQESLMDAQGNFEYPEHEGAYHILCNLDAYIESLQEEPVSSDLEEAAWLYYDKNRLPIPPECDLHKEFIDFFKAGAQWQKSKDESSTEDLEEVSKKYSSCIYLEEVLSDDDKEVLKARLMNTFRAGAKWQKGKTLSDVKKAVTGKAMQFSMGNVEAWGDDSNGKTIKLKGRVTFQVNNPEFIIDALFTELENDD